MHRAAVKLSPEVLNKIIATVTFGDGGQQAPGKPNNIYKSPVGEIPAWPKALNGRIRFNCNGNDIVTPSAASFRMTVANGNFRLANLVDRQLQITSNMRRKERTLGSLLSSSKHSLISSGRQVQHR